MSQTVLPGSTGGMQGGQGRFRVLFLDQSNSSVRTPAVNAAHPAVGDRPRGADPIAEASILPTIDDLVK